MKMKPSVYDLFPFKVTLKNVFLCQGGGSTQIEERGDLIKRPILCKYSRF